MTLLLDVRNLGVVYDTPRGSVVALDGVNLALKSGQTLGVVGESGSGKSTLGLAIGRLMPENARRLSGDLGVLGTSVFGGDDEHLRILRRDALGYIFQNPMAALDPTMRIGRQLTRAIGPQATHDGMFALLSRVGLSNRGRIDRNFPHELSGGMAQRVAIAIAIARNPRLIIADEPTASLDAWLRDQILELLVSMCRAAHASLLLLSHDLSVCPGTASMSRSCMAAGLSNTQQGTSFFTGRHIPTHTHSWRPLRAPSSRMSASGRYRASRPSSWKTVRDAHLRHAANGPRSVRRNAA